MTERNGRASRFIHSTWGALLVQMVAFVAAGTITAYVTISTLRMEVRRLTSIVEFTFCTAVPANLRSTAAVFSINCDKYENRTIETGSETTEP